MNGLKEKITLRGVIQTYTRRLYPGDIYIEEKVLVKHTRESVRRLLIGFINQKWLKRFLVTSGTAGCALLALCYPTLVLTGVCLSVALALMWLILYRILDKRI